MAKDKYPIDDDLDEHDLEDMASVMKPDDPDGTVRNVVTGELINDEERAKGLEILRTGRVRFDARVQEQLKELGLTEDEVIASLFEALGGKKN